MYYDGLIYMATDVGAVTVVDAANGQRVSQQRIEGVFSASPVAADGKIYFVSENGETVVLQAGRTPTVLARNDWGSARLRSGDFKPPEASSVPMIRVRHCQRRP